MDKRTRQNWAKIKKALEAAGKTESLFYQRALVIEKTGRDPFDSETLA